MLARFVAVITLVGLVVALTFGALLPLSTWRNAQFVQLESAIDERSKLAESIARLEIEKASFASDDLTAFMWVGAQVAEATARVQSEINAIGQDAGIQMRSIAPQNTAALEDSIAFRLEFEAQLDQLSELLRMLEAHQPALVVSRANIRRLARPGEQSEFPALFVQLDVAAPVKTNEEASP